jgi:hypothetical protein
VSSIAGIPAILTYWLPQNSGLVEIVAQLGFLPVLYQFEVHEIHLRGQGCNRRLGRVGRLSSASQRYTRTHLRGQGRICRLGRVGRLYTRLTCEARVVIAAWVEWVACTRDSPARPG